MDHELPTQDDSMGLRVVAFIKAWKITFKMVEWAC